MTRLSLLAVALLAGTAVADVPLGSTTTTATRPAATGTPTGITGTGTPTGVLAEIQFLAEFLASELGMTFDNPLDELEFFFTVAALYFQVVQHQHQHGGPAGGGSGSGTTTAKPAGGTATPAAGTTLGSLTSVAK